jgi:hypothetical protein
VLEREIAVFLWRALLKDRFKEILPKWIAFLESKEIKGVSKDTWSCFLDFASETYADMSNFDPQCMFII